MSRVSQAQAQENRKRVVMAAARLFRERGIQNVSVADLMNSVGLTHGGFYKQFASKDALLAEAVELAFAQLGDSLVGDTRAADDGEAGAGRPGEGAPTGTGDPTGKDGPVRTGGGTVRAQGDGHAGDRGGPAGPEGGHREPADDEPRTADEGQADAEEAAGRRPHAADEDRAAGQQHAAGVEGTAERDRGAPARSAAPIPVRYAELIDFYLSPEHRDDPGGGCPAAGFAADLARAPEHDGSHRAYTEGIRSFAKALDPEGTGSGLATISTLVGAILLSRATSGTPLSEEVLAAAHRTINQRPA